jgi:hypothetical protein
MRNRLKAATLLGLLAASAAGLAASAEPAARAAPKCFFTRDWSGWKASPDGKAIYIRVGVSNIYRLDFSNACSAANGIGVHLVIRTRGSSTICGPLDLDLKVSHGHGFATPCIVSGVTPLSAKEASALPKNLRP